MTALDTTEQFERYLDSGASWRGVVIRELVLSSYGEQMGGRDFQGALFLGCRMGEGVMKRINDTGGLCFPEWNNLPFHPYRSELYDREILFSGFDLLRPESYWETLDYRIFQYFRSSGRSVFGLALDSLAQRLHDYSISEALQRFLALVGGGRRVIGVMGGHGMIRGGEDYRRVAWISRELTRRGFIMISGGGPGAMEATHLGAWFSGYGDSSLEEAHRKLAEAPGYKDQYWLSQAFRVIGEFPLAACNGQKPQSLGVPTWSYGHEPPTPFATHIAKYFANSVREEGLLGVALGGVIYSPGNHGTVQEIFQDACQNRYKTYDIGSPMVFLNREYWEKQIPAYPLLQKMAEGSDYRDLIALYDEPGEVVKFLVEKNVR